MDHELFDNWTRSLASSTSRRRAIRSLAGAAVAGLLAHLGLDEAAAACVKPGNVGCEGPQNKKCCPGARCKGGSKSKTGKCVCKAGLTKCGTKCVNLLTTPQHCGGCGQSCGLGQTCQGGTCVDGGTECSPACTGGQTCQGGTCACPAGTETSCGSAMGGECYCCPTGMYHCGEGICRECCIGADCGCANHNPSCRICGEGGTCVCQDAWRRPYCNGVCTTCCKTDDCTVYGMSPGDGFICDTSRDPAANYCRCQNGMVEPCYDATNNKSYCPDLKTDEQNCGACGRNCLGWNCLDGVCTRPD